MYHLKDSCRRDLFELSQRLVHFLELESKGFDSLELGSVTSFLPLFFRVFSRWFWCKNFKSNFKKQ